MNMKTVWLMVLLALGTTSGVYARDVSHEVAVFTPQHRPAEELAPVLRDFLDPGATLRVSSQQIIVRSSPSNLAELEGILGSIDVAPRRLLISVRQGGPGEGPGGRIYRTGPRGEAGQRLQVLEGEIAFIDAGQAIPTIERTQAVTAQGTQVTDSLTYLDATRGFHVRARLAGERVFLDLAPFATRESAQGGGRLDRQQLATTVAVELGEWIELAGTSAEPGERTGQRVYSTRERDPSRRPVLVRVDLVP